LRKTCFLAAIGIAPESPRSRVSRQIRSKIFLSGLMLLDLTL
jgi:hypothetical protein